ncbi:hypothetical protein [Flagellimonas sp.]|uniref:hypothetical protein n=1 Tax=Flagellimonas sp. TaxID=2058762 RepID=UPI003BA98712|tara:strand:- start:220 stop:543 length:324 start_codon:yes stop_codon:yes gene_type:complete
MRTEEGAIKVLEEETNKSQIPSSTIETPIQPTGLQNLVCFAAVPVDGDYLQPIFPNGPVHLRNGFRSRFFGQVYGFERFSGSWGISTIALFQSLANISLGAFRRPCV